jgi:hypothetical protein
LDDGDAWEEGEEEEEEGEVGRKGAGDESGGGEPPSFSRVDLQLPAAEVRRHFPHFPGVEAAVECEVR